MQGINKETTEDELSLMRSERNETVGRFAVAKCDLNPGDVILAEVPFAFGPKTDSPPLCLGCCTRLNSSSKFCSSCGWPVCNSTCEIIPAHKNAECIIFSNAKVPFQQVENFTAVCLQYECITPLRVLLAKDADPDRWEREIKVMESHNESRKTTPIWHFNQVNIVNYLRGPCKLKARFSEELIHTVCGILEANAFEARSVSGHPIRCLYPKYAILSHNCISNVTHSVLCTGSGDTNDFRVIVRASTKIAEGAELFSSYTYSLWPTLTRREYLKQSKYFDCYCARCSDPSENGTHMSTLKCSECINGMVMSCNPLDSDANWICSQCSNVQPSEKIKTLYGILQSEIDFANKTEENCIELLQNLFKKYKNVLHPWNAYFCILRSHLINIYGILGNRLENECPRDLIEKNVSACKNLLHVLDVIEPGYSRIRGLTLYELSRALALLEEQEKNNYYKPECLENKLKEIIKILQEAVAILNLEPVSTVEGKIGILARKHILQLKEYYEDFKKVAEIQNVLKPPFIEFV